MLMKTLEIRGKILRKTKGYTYNIDYISATNFPRVPNMVPNWYQDTILLPIGSTCK